MDKRIFQKCFLPLLFIVALGMGCNLAYAQNNGNEGRYNLAVYATGIQNDRPLSVSLQTVIQNRTITLLTANGNYRLIERSGEFLKQLKNEQTMQQSGDVADGQIADIGAGYGAEKICVVSTTIIDNYLYIATRIVDVATKTSFESGDAEVTNYNSISVLTKTLEMSLNRMLTNTSNAKTSTLPSVKEFTNVDNSKGSFDQYKTRLKSENGAFLDMNSLAYKEFISYRNNKLYGLIGLGSGLICSTIGTIVMVHYMNELNHDEKFASSYDHEMAYASGSDREYYESKYWEYYYYMEDDQHYINVGAITFGIGLVGVAVGVLEIKTGKKHLQRSFQYYINGDNRTASLDFHPYFGSNNVMGMGLTLCF